MTSREQTLRVFRCPHCGYTGYRQVSSRDDDSKCNLCSKIISPSPEMSYVTSVEEARKAMQDIVFSSPKRSPTTHRHGLGVKKRVFYMISDLSELNDGKGVSIDRVLEECREANIDRDKAERFIDQLQDEGQIVMIFDQLNVVREENF